MGVTEPYWFLTKRCMSMRRLLFLVNSKSGGQEAIANMLKKSCRIPAALLSSFFKMVLVPVQF